MSQLVLQPATVPVDMLLPSSVQQLLNLIAANLQVAGLDTVTGVLVSSTEPVAADRDKLWVKKDAVSDRVVGLYTYKGSWNPLPLIIANGETEPVSPVKGELFFNTKVGALKFYNGTTWSTNTYHTDTTANRPTGVPVNYLFFDTDIQRLLRYTASGWTTQDGFIGEIRMADPNLSEDDVKTRNPGWVIFEAMSGHFPVGRSATDDEDFSLNKEGGRKSVAWSAKGTAAAGGSREAPTLGAISIDGKEIASRSNLGNTPTSLDSGEFEILPPYKAILFIRKDF